ncbi:MAG: glycosyltransferase family 39 protein [Chloroflexi bacterium]|nr:glycosyltransferase family 39 protein [Chloroflexota bacterium]
MSERTLMRLTLAFVLLGVLARVAIACYLGDVVDAPPLLTDQRSYHALGERLLTGHGYSFAYRWYPFTPANTPTAHWSFLYPLFVAAVYGVFGAHPLAVRLAQSVLGGLLLPWLAWRLAARLVRTEGAPPSAWRHVPYVAAICAAGYAYFALYAATLMTETAYIAALLWSLERAMLIGARLRAGERVPWTTTTQFGLSLGLATLLRQSFLPWVPVLFLWLLWQTRRRLSIRALRPLLLAGVLLLLSIAPWTLRNQRVYGHFLLLNSNTGYAMYSAQHPMHGYRFDEFAAAPLPDDLAGRNEAEWDSDLLRRGICFVLDEPQRYLALCLSRVRAFVEFWPTPGASTINNIGSVLSFGLFLPFMLYGLALALCRSSAAAGALDRPSRNLLLLFMATYSFVTIMTWAMVRYRLPVDAVALLFAALALVDLGERLARRLRGAPHRPTRRGGTT